MCDQRCNAAAYNCSSCIKHSLRSGAPGLFVICLLYIVTWVVAVNAGTLGQVRACWGCLLCHVTVLLGAADGSSTERQVDLIFPATARTVLRLVQAWWERKVGAWVQRDSLTPLPSGIIEHGVCMTWPPPACMLLLKPLSAYLLLLATCLLHVLMRRAASPPSARLQRSGRPPSTRRCLRDSSPM